MNWAFTMQKFQDWFTQQWVILWGKKFDPSKNLWLFGLFGELNEKGEDFIVRLAEKEQLVIKKNQRNKGILNSIDELQLPKNELDRLSKKIIDFYEHTSSYKLKFEAKWNPFFLFFGVLINRLFSKRLNQLNIPIKNKDTAELTNEIIHLINPETGETKHTIWLRKWKSNGQIVYSGVYSTCKLPSGQNCIKVVFPLPKGNATVIMKPSVGANGELILNSSGKSFGDAGFYFLLNDSNNNFWSQFVSSFTDKLTIIESNGGLQATQTLKFWRIKVVKFYYQMEQ